MGVNALMCFIGLKNEVHFPLEIGGVLVQQYGEWKPPHVKRNECFQHYYESCINVAVLKHKNEVSFMLSNDDHFGFSSFPICNDSRYVYKVEIKFERKKLND